jgi:hypothetical protein
VLGHPLIGHDDLLCLDGDESSPSFFHIARLNVASYRGHRFGSGYQISTSGMLLATTTAARDPQGQRTKMEAVKIYLLMALIGVIAAASHRKSRRPTPEQSST